MTGIEDIKPGLVLTGIEPGAIVTVMAAVPIGAGAVQVIYKLADGSIRERLVSEGDVDGLSV